MDGITTPLLFLKRGSCLRRADWEGSSLHCTCRLISQHQAVISLVRAYLKISPERISGDLAGDGDLFGNLVLKRAIDVGLRYEIPLAPAGCSLQLHPYIISNLQLEMDGITTPLLFLKRGSCLRRADWEGSSWHCTCRLISQHQAVISLARPYLKISPEGFPATWRARVTFSEIYFIND